jgi:hypothetical protein
LLVFGAAALIGCARGSERAPTTARATVTGAELGSSSNDDAVMRLATARCERELACNKIGEGRAYEDQPTCLAQIGELMDEEAGRSTCPRGVEPLEVSRCLLDIQRTECGGELERTTNIPSCTKAALCVH